MRPESPPGVRSCHRGGIWEFAADAEGAVYVKAELARIVAVMAESDRDLLVAELFERMEDAQAGDLDFVKMDQGKRFGDVDQMAVSPDVLELRFSTTTGAGDGQRKVRLYFGEPEVLPHALVALKLASKYPDEAGLAEQDQHARMASVRGDRHVDRRLDGVAH